MNQTTKIPNIDYTKTTSLDTYSGEKIWQSGYILRQVSEETNGIPVNTVIPIQIFFDPQTGKILDNILPSTLRKEYNFNPQVTQSLKNDNQSSSVNWEDLPTSSPNQTPSQPQWGEQPQQQPQWGEQPQQQPQQQPQWGEQPQQQPQQQPQWGEQPQPPTPPSNNPQPISNWSWEQ